MSQQRGPIDYYPLNFKLSLEERMRAQAGIPAHMRRKRRIEDLEMAYLETLDEAYLDALARAPGDFEGAEQAACETAARLDLALLNNLIERHNSYYPIEANLPIDVTSGKLMLGSVPWEPLAPETAETLLANAKRLRKHQ